MLLGSYKFSQVPREIFILDLTAKEVILPIPMQISNSCFHALEMKLVLQQMGKSLFEIITGAPHSAKYSLQ
jgi:hypothetical protein